MSASTWREWSCDRCGATERRTANEYQPIGWRGVQTYVPPLSSENDPTFGRKHICGPCARALADFFTLAAAAEAVDEEAVSA